MPPYHDKKRWRFRGVVNGKHYSGTAPKGDNTQRAAVALERELLRKLEARVYTGKMPTVAEFAARFLDYQKARTRPSTYELQSVQINLHTLPSVGKRPLDSIESRDLDQLITEWSKTAMPRTVNSRMGTVLRMFSLAVEWRIIPFAPTAKALKVPKDVPRFLTQDEVHALLSNAHHRWRSMMLVGLRTGLRIGELRGLQWGDIDFVSSQLTVRRSDPGREGEASGPTKGGRSRVVPLTPDAKLELEAERRKHEASPAPDDWVWPGAESWQGRHGRVRSRSEGGCVNAISSALARASIVDRAGDRLGWHTLRHTFASWLAIRGVSLREIQDLLGHASIRQTERYAHLAPNAVLHSAVSSLDFALMGSHESGPQKALNASSGLDAGPRDDD